MTTLSFTFEGVTPPKKNSKRIVWRAGRPRLFPSQRHRVWHTRALWEIKAQKNRVEGVVFPLAQVKACRLLIHYGDLRARDNSNLWESVADLMVDAGVLADDNWKVTGSTAQEGNYRKGRPGWELTIEA